MGYVFAHRFTYNKGIVDCNQMGPAEKKHYKQVLSTEAHYLPPLHSPVVRLTCNQQVLSSNLRGGSTFLPSPLKYNLSERFIFGPKMKEFCYQKTIVIQLKELDVQN